MSISTLITRGFGNGTFTGTPSLIITRGYTIGGLWNIQSAASTTWSTQSQASSAWVVRGDTNIVVSSEDFTVGTYSLVSTSLSTGHLDPIGGLSATKLIESAELAYHAIVADYHGLDDNAIYCFSIFAKGDERTHLTLHCRTKGDVYPSATFNLSDGSVLGSSLAESYGIEQYGDYYRIYATFNVGSGAYTPKFYPQLYNAGSLYTGDGTSGLTIWGMQVNKSSTLLPYTKTFGTAETGTTWTVQ